MTEQLMRYALIGESIPGGRAVKILRLAAFAATQNPSMDFSIRVYMVEDTQDALEVNYECPSFVKPHLPKKKSVSRYKKLRINCLGNF